MGHPKFTDTPTYTASNGAPIFNPNASQRVGTSGPLLLQDFHLIDLLAHFDRERIPERYVSLIAFLCPVADCFSAGSSTPRVLAHTACLRSRKTFPT
jgi:Catalase